MRTLLTALTALLLFATPVVAGNSQDASTAYDVGDYQKALKLLAPKAKNGHPRAQFNLGMMYFKGNGVQMDYGKAFEWYRSPAQPSKDMLRRSQISV